MPPEFDAESFRREITRLESKSTPEAAADFEDAAIQWAAVLAEHFGFERDGDMWTRIEGAFTSSIAKCAGDGMKFLSLSLEYVHADAAAVSRSEVVLRMMKIVKANGPDWAAAWLPWVRQNIYLVVVFGRDRWQSIKDAAAKQQKGAV